MIGPSHGYHIRASRNKFNQESFIRTPICFLKCRSSIGPIAVGRPWQRQGPRTVRKPRKVTTGTIGNHLRLRSVLNRGLQRIRANRGRTTSQSCPDFGLLRMDNRSIHSIIGISAPFRTWFWQSIGRFSRAKRTVRLPTRKTRLAKALKETR